MHIKLKAIGDRIRNQSIFQEEHFIFELMRKNQHQVCIILNFGRQHINISARNRSRLPECVLAPPSTCRDAHNPFPLFYAKCSWGDPLVGNFARTDSIAWGRQQWNGRPFLMCNLFPANSAYDHITYGCQTCAPIKLFVCNRVRPVYSDDLTQPGVHEGLESMGGSGAHITCASPIQQLR